MRGLAFTALLGAAVCLLPDVSLADQPVASCSWTPRSTIEHIVGMTVRNGKYTEAPNNGYRTAKCVFALKRSAGGDVTLNYSQGHDSFRDVDGATGPGVTRQGTAIERTSKVQDLGICPPDQPNCPFTALLTVLTQRDRKGNHLGPRYTAYIELGVQDGYKEFSIEVTSYGKSLPVSPRHAIHAVEQLAHAIMPRFAAVP